jgi:tRNA dimethylallyltransferase
MKNKKLPKLIVILGPTASGKTNLAIKLAKEFSGEIISADSRQIYKEMDIGTAKPTKSELKTVPHHLVNIILPNQKFNVALYKKRAHPIIKDIQKRNKVPFLVGGTGLYIKAVVDNLSFPKVIWQKKLREKLEKKNTEQLFKMYKKLDPLGAKKIDKKNKRRLIRAIEVCQITKKPFWEQRRKQKPQFETLQIGIKLSQKVLKKRIKKRAALMLQKGLKKEAQKLFKKYGDIPPLQTIGYQEWKGNNISGRLDKKEGEIKKDIILHTLQFAKRQMTWFKKEKRINWINNYSQAKKLIKNFLK